MARAAADIRIIPAPAAPAASAITLSWLPASASSAASATPTFELHDHLGMTAKGYLAGTPDALLVRVDVTDEVHINTQNEGSIWNGDFLRVSLDGRGDGPQGGPPNTVGLFGPDDSSIGFALTPTGPQGWVYGTNVPADGGAYPADLLHFTRDEAKHLTRYDIRIPWARFHTRPGTFPEFGISIALRNVNAQNGPIGQSEWGQGANGPYTGQFQKVSWGTPPAGDFTAITPMKTEIWDSEDHANIHVAIRSAAPVTLKVSDGVREQTESIPGGQDITRRLIEYTPAPDATAATLQVSITPPQGAATQEKIPLVLAESVVRTTVGRLRAAAVNSPDPLFTRHLRSVEAVIWTEWGRAALYKHSNQAAARKTLGLLQNIGQGFAPGAPATKWETYYKDGMPLLLAYDSPRDHTTQWYTLTLPKGWDPAKTRDQQQIYPLFVELHGAGDAHLLNTPASYYGNAKFGGLGYESGGTYAMYDRAGYHIMPYGRGNSGYRDIGETDIWEAISDFDKSFKSDPDRNYLYGFSMGGGGTFNLGRETPDRWAAIAILGMGVHPTDWQAKNLSMVPVYIWGGQDDVIAFHGAKPKDIIEQAAAAIKAAGGTVKDWSSPGIGHNYLGEVQKDSIEWLKTFTRKRPDAFSFTVDEAQHPGVWGIAIHRDDQQAGLPSFDCTIKGQNVAITTHSSTGCRVVLGDEGLHMTGEVTLTINGKQVYSGPATNKPVTEGEIAWGRRWR